MQELHLKPTLSMFCVLKIISTILKNNINVAINISVGQAVL